MLSILRDRRTPRDATIQREGSFTRARLPVARPGSTRGLSYRKFFRSTTKNKKYILIIIITIIIIKKLNFVDKFERQVDAVCVR